MRAIDKTPRTERQQHMIDAAAELALDVMPESQLIGYVVLAMYSDGAMRTAGWKPNSQEHGMGAHLFNAWAKQGLEHHIAYAEGVDACYSVLNGDA